MADDATQQTTSGGTLRIPPELTQKFPDVIELIQKSESMNDEERQYWIDIMPIMTPEQLQQLRGILQNERDQLAAIDAKYATEIAKIGEQQKPIEQMGEAMKQKKQERSTQEQAARSQEEQAAEDLLKGMD